jgi:hypothetical protein
MMPRRMHVDLLGLIPAVAAIGLSLCASASAAQGPEGAVRVDSTAQARGAEFCRYQRAATAADTTDKRFALMGAVRDSDLAYAEKAWLIFELVDTNTTLRQLLAMEPPGADMGQLDYMGSVSANLFYGLDVVCYRTLTKGASAPFGASAARSEDGKRQWEESYQAVDVHLGILKNEIDPSGMSRNVVAWVEADKVRELAQKRLGPQIDSTVSALLASAPSGMGAEGTLCRFYGMSVNAADDKERLQLAEAIRGSDVSSDEKSFLIFSLIAPGMPAKTASAIVDPAGPTWRVDGRPMALVEGRREFGSGLPKLVFRNGVEFLVTNDAAPMVAEIHLDLRK